MYTWRFHYGKAAILQYLLKLVKQKEGGPFFLGWGGGEEDGFDFCFLEFF